MNARMRGHCLEGLSAGNERVHDEPKKQGRRLAPPSTAGVLPENAVRPGILNLGSKSGRVPSAAGTSAWDAHKGAA